MNKMKSIIIILVMLALTSWILAEENCATCGKHANGGTKVAGVEQKAGGTMSKQAVEPMKLPGFGKKVGLDKDKYFTYDFVKKVKMGANTLKVNIQGKEKKPLTSYQVLVSYDMPSMKGMHAVNDKPMQVNRSGNYLLPLNFVMPGVWQVDLKIMDGKSVISTGSFTVKI